MEKTKDESELRNNNKYMLDVSLLRAGRKIIFKYAHYIRHHNIRTNTGIKQNCFHLLDEREQSSGYKRHFRSN